MLWVSLVDLAVCSVGSWAGRGAVLCVCNFLLCKTAGLLDCWMAGVVEDVEGWVALLNRVRSDASRYAGPPAPYHRDLTTLNTTSLSLCTFAYYLDSRGNLYNVFAARSADRASARGSRILATC